MLQQMKLTTIGAIVTAILLAGVGAYQYQSRAEERTSCMLLLSLPGYGPATPRDIVARRLDRQVQKFPVCTRYVATAYERIVESDGIPYHGTGFFEPSPTDEIEDITISGVLSEAATLRLGRLAQRRNARESCKAFAAISPSQTSAAVRYWCEQSLFAQAARASSASN